MTNQINPNIDVADRIRATELLTAVVEFVNICDVSQCPGTMRDYVIKGKAVYLESAHRLLGLRKKEPSPLIQQYNLCQEITIDQPMSAQEKQARMHHVAKGEIETKKFVIGALLSTMQQAQNAGCEIESDRLNHLLSEAIPFLGILISGRWQLIQPQTIVSMVDISMNDTYNGHMNS